MPEPLDVHPTQERPVAPERVCLVKGCNGPTYEVRSWAGILMARLHDH